MSAVTVDEIKRIERGTLRAFVTVTLAGKLRIHSVRIVQQPGQAAWVSMPQNEVKSQEGGKSKYYPTVEVTDENLKRQISEAVLAAWRAKS
jgi:DNA-binding cell septation regulator SpoVG